MAAVEAIYARSDGGAGCCAHVAIEDCNLSDRTIQWCLDRAEHDDFKTALRGMLAMPHWRECLSDMAGSDFWTRGREKADNPNGGK